MSLYSIGGKILLFAALPLLGQTRIPAGKLPISQVACNGVGGTRVSPQQIGGPSPCVTVPALSTEAWKVINTRCTRCHGNDLVPGDVHLVGGLDMRTRQGLLTGGSRGPALKPGDLYGSLVFLFASRCQVCGLTMTMSPAPLPPLRDLQASAISAGFAHVPPDSSEESVAMPPHDPLTEADLFTLRDWILAGAP